MLADTLGRPIRIILTAGQTGDITTAPALLDGLCADAVLADKLMTATPCELPLPPWVLSQ